MALLAVAFAESLGFTVSFEPIPGRAGGWCDPLGALDLDVSGEAVPYVAGWGEDGALEPVHLESLGLDC